MKSSLAILLLAFVLVFLLLSFSLGCGLIEKDASFYNDPVLQYLGMEQEKIIQMYGEPDIRGTIPGPGGEFLYYHDEKISFIFAGEDEVVNNLELFPGGKVLGVQVGMSFNEIEEILGPPRDRGYDEHSHMYSMIYFLGEERDDMGEVEMWFCAASNDAPTESVMILWKKYWGW